MEKLVSKIKALVQRTYHAMTISLRLTRGLYLAILHFSGRLHEIASIEVKIQPQLTDIELTMLLLV